MTGQAQDTDLDTGLLADIEREAVQLAKLAGVEIEMALRQFLNVNNDF